MPLSCKTVSPSGPDSFSYIETYKDGSQRYWTVRLHDDKPMVRKEGSLTEGSEVLYVEEHYCDTLDQLVAWYNSYRTAVDRIAEATESKRQHHATAVQPPSQGAPLQAGIRNDATTANRQNSVKMVF